MQIIVGLNLFNMRKYYFLYTATLVIFVAGCFFTLGINSVFANAPVVSGISPTKSTPGEVITVFGSNLTGSAQLISPLGSKIDVQESSNSSGSELRFEIPDSIIAGTYSISVTNTDGTATSPRNLTVSKGGESFNNTVQPNLPTEGLPSFGQLIELVFSWSLNILGIVVFVMIFYAGFSWFTAAGNTAKINDAKSRITNAVTGAIILLAAWIILYTINPDLVGGRFTLPGLGTSNSESGSGNEGGGGDDTGGNYYCVDVSNPAKPARDYAGTLRQAMDKVLDYMPDIAAAPNTTDNAQRFLHLVAYELQLSGFNATENVKNGHDIPSSARDIIGVWSDGDSEIERYDAIRSSGSGTLTISEAATVGFAGHIPLDCTY